MPCTNVQNWPRADSAVVNFPGHLSRRRPVVGEYLGSFAREFEKRLAMTPRPFDQAPNRPRGILDCRVGISLHEKRSDRDGLSTTLIEFVSLFDGRGRD